MESRDVDMRQWHGVLPVASLDSCSLLLCSMPVLTVLSRHGCLNESGVDCEDLY